MIRSIIFVRVSTEQQTLEQQESVMMEIALRDFKKSEILIIKGKESASKLDKDQRQTLSDLYMAIEEHKSIERVYFFAVDRLSRKASIVSLIADELAEKGIDCYFHNPYQLHTLSPDGRRNQICEMMLYFLGKGAEMEIALKNERVAAKRQLMKQNHQVATGTLAYGYKKNADKTIGIDENQAQYVRQMFDMYLSGQHSLSTISKRMIELGAMSDGKLSTVLNRVRSILTNPLYSGGKPKKGDNHYPPIVTKDIQNKVTKALSKNKKGEKKSVNYTYIAKNLFYSKATGYKMILNQGNCVYQTNTDENPKVSIGINPLESIVWLNTINHLGCLKAKERHNNRKEIDNKITEITDTITRIKSIIDKLDKDYNRMYQAYKKGIVPLDAYETDVAENRKKCNIYSETLTRHEIELQRLKELKADTKYKGTLKLVDVSKYDDVMKKELAEKIFHKVFIEKDRETGHAFITFQLNELIADLQIYYEYWSSGGVMHLWECRFDENGKGHRLFDKSDKIVKKAKRERH